MKYFAYAMAWASTACAIAFTVYVTKEAGALIAFIFPSCISISETIKSSNNK